MKDKLLCWIGDAVYRFGIVKEIHDNFDCDLYAILDIDILQKEFFEKQKLVKFQKVWYYRDHVNLEQNKKPDINYLISFEKKYRINLWSIAYTERYFYKYNIHNFEYFGTRV